MKKRVAVVDVDLGVLHAHPLPPIPVKTDKDSRGRVFLIGGSTASPGAALLAGEAALRGGAGKLLVGTGRSIALGIGLAAPEFGLAGLAETADGEPDSTDSKIDQCLDQCDTVLLGPGLMNAPNARLLALRILEAISMPLILDAAAITAFVDDFPSLRAGQQPRILTPHAGEMAKLMGVSRDSIERAPQDAAIEAAKALDCILVLKGAETYIANPEGRIFRHTGGVAGLATAGSGDTLAGLMAALLARGATPLNACLWSVFIHGQAGVSLSKTVGPLGFLARQLPELFPHLLDTFQPALNAASR